MILRSGMNPEEYVFLRITKQVFLRIDKSGKNPYGIRETRYSLPDQTFYQERRDQMEREKKVQGREIVVLDEGIDFNAEGHYINRFGCCVIILFLIW